MLFFQSFDIPLGTSWADIISFNPAKLHHVVITPVLAINIGTSGTGKPLAANQDYSMTWMDFDKSKLEGDLFILRGYAPVATTVNILLVTEQ